MTRREEFRKYVKPFVDDIASYGTHSVKSGATSNPACRSISADLLDMHTSWECTISKERYINHTVNDRLFSFGFCLLMINYLIISLSRELSCAWHAPDFLSVFAIGFFRVGFFWLPWHGFL